MSEIAAARIDVHHAAEQVAAIDREVLNLEIEMDKVLTEQKLIHHDFFEKCQRLALLREKHANDTQCVIVDR